MNTVVTERRCVICTNVLSESNPTDRCRRHDSDEGKRPLFRLIAKPVEVVKRLRGRPPIGKKADTSTLETASPTATPEEVLGIVAHAYEVSREETLVHRRTSQLVHARQVLMYLLRTELKMSLPKIAKFLSRDHTTVIYGCDQITQKIKTDSTLAEEVEAIRNRISR